MSAAATQFKEIVKYTAVCGVCGGPRYALGGSVCKSCYSKADVRKTYLNHGATADLPFTTLVAETVQIPIRPRLIRIKREPPINRIEIDRILNAPENLWHPGLFKGPLFRGPRGPYKRKPKAPSLPPPIMVYPYVRAVRDEHAELLAVNALVPAGMPGREDICQEIMIALWEKKITIEQLRASRADVSAFVRAFKRENLESGGYAISLDEPMYDGRSWHDVLSSDQP